MPSSRGNDAANGTPSPAISSDEQRIVCLEPTSAGRVRDKKLADERGLILPPGTLALQDPGFRGYATPRRWAAPRSSPGRSRAEVNSIPSKSSSPNHQLDTMPPTKELTGF